MESYSLDLESLLRQWDLSHLLEILKEENVTLSTLEIIKDVDLDDLTKSFKLGDRVAFKHNMTKWRMGIKKPLKENCNLLEKRIEPTSSTLPNILETHVNLSDILKQHKASVRIVESYEKNKYFNEDQRNSLVTLIATYYHSNHIHMSLQESYAMENQILTMFSTEKLHSYRTEKRGKLYCKYNNMKRNVAFKKENETNAVETSLQSNIINGIVPEINAKEAVHCLKYDNLANEEFFKMWDSCSKYRVHQIFEECSSLTDILSIWSQFKGPHCAALIQKDFTVIHNQFVPIYDWETIIIKLHKLLLNGGYIKDITIRGVLRKIDESESAENMSSFMMKVLWCLHGYLFSTSKVARKDKNGKNTYGKYTIKDSQESFMFLAQNKQEMEKHSQFLRKRNENIQPFIFAVGDDNLDGDHYEYFLYLDGNLVRFSDFQRAFDTCFKAFHLFHLEYPIASCQFWTFVQIFLYEINTHGKQYSKVMNLITDIKQV